MLRNPNGALVAIDRRIKVERFFILQVQAVSDQHIAQNEARIASSSACHLRGDERTKKALHLLGNAGGRSTLAAARAQL